MNLLDKIFNGVNFDKRIEDIGQILAKGIALVKTASAAVTLTLNDCVCINSGNVIVSLPIAVPDNKGKVFVVQFTNGTLTTSGIADISDTPKTIVAAGSISQYHVYICVSAGDTSLGNNGYYVFRLTGSAAATS